MSVPGSASQQLSALLWAEADAIGWLHMSNHDKALKYDDWVKRPDVGGVLSLHIDPRQVRVYLKDTLLKAYSRQRQGDPVRPFRVLGLSDSCSVAEEYEKPHGRRLTDGRVVCWGTADNWKAVVMACFERASLAPDAVPYAVVLSGASGRLLTSEVREIAEKAAGQLGIGRVHWLST